jgi:hypothetical protein
VRHYWVKGTQGTRVPSLLFEIKIDLQDMRSGYRFSDWGLFLRAPWIADGELDWTSDMVVAQDLNELEEIRPDRAVTWPELADQKMTRYLISYYHPRAWRHGRLGLFSGSSESRADFTARCREALRGLRERDLRKVREVFYHRISGMEQRLVREVEQADLGEAWRARRIAEIQDMFTELRDSLSRVLVDTDQPVDDLPELAFRPDMGEETGAKLKALRREFIERYNDVLNDYERQANEIEPYDVPLAYSHIEIVSRAIVWE